MARKLQNAIKYNILLNTRKAGGFVVLLFFYFVSFCHLLHSRKRISKTRIASFTYPFSGKWSMAAQISRLSKPAMRFYLAQFLMEIFYRCQIYTASALIQINGRAFYFVQPFCNAGIIGTSLYGTLSRAHSSTFISPSTSASPVRFCC